MLAEIATATTDYLQSPSPLADQISAAALSAWVIQLLKNSKWSGLGWINEHSTVVNRIISVVFAILSTSGIHAFWQGSASGDSILAGGGGVFTLALADGWLTELQSSVWKTMQSFIMQQMVYQGLIKHEPGQKAADIVAGEVVENKDALAKKVVAEGLRRDPNSLLKLAEDHPVEKAAAEKKRPEQDDKPVDWNWENKTP